MDIHTLPTSQPFTLLIDDDQRSASVELAKKMVAAKLDFAFLCPEPEELPKEIQAHCVDDPISVPRKAEIIVDLSWTSIISEETLIYLDHLEFDPEILVLTTAATDTAGNATSLMPGIKVIGFNGLPGFFPQSSTVEIAPPMDSDPQDISRAKRFFRTLGFDSEQVEDRAGYVLPRIMSMIINEAAFCVMEGVAEPADIDTAMKLGTNYPKGPLAWADEIGIDVVSALLTTLEAEYGQERYRPCQLLLQMNRAGRIGKESGRGFYTYDSTNS